MEVPKCGGSLIINNQLNNQISFPGQIHLIRNDHELIAAAAGLSLACEFGFDTETKPSFNKGEYFKVALLQLSTEKDAYLIRMQGITQFQILKDIFENSEVIKVGAAIRDDLKELQKTFKFTPQNFIELQDVAKRKGLQNFGLKGMTEEVLQATISKAAKLSNWEAESLTDRQLLYAATDAWIGLKIFKALEAVSGPWPGAESPKK